jgi:hypothetical protein
MKELRKCSHDVPKLVESLEKIGLPRKLIDSSRKIHEIDACWYQPIEADKLVEETMSSCRLPLLLMNMTKQQALEHIHGLVKEGIQWHDQGMGHGHWEFHLPEEKLNELFEVAKVADGKTG